MAAQLKEYDISHEMWREYEYVNAAGQLVVYHIDSPVTLFIRPGGSTHRVSDSNGVTHLLPAPEVFGCAIRWENKPDVSRCEF